MPSPSRSRTAPVLAAAAVAAVTAITVVAGHLAGAPKRHTVSVPTAAPPISSTAPAISSPATMAPAELPARQTMFALAADSGYTLAPSGENFTDSQTRDVDKDGLDAGVQVEIWAAGAGRPAFDPTAASVDLNGVAARWATVGGGATTATSLVFAYATGGWIAVSPTGTPDPTITIAVARAVRPLQPTAISVPVTVTYVPAGLVLQGVVSSTVTRDGVGGAAGIDCLIDFARPGGDTALTIDVSGLALAGPPGSRSVVIGGRSWSLNQTSDMLMTIAADHVVHVSAVSGSGATVSLAELKQVAAGLQMAPDFSDRTTWFAAQTALP